jgi:hypothetical protein
MLGKYKVCISKETLSESHILVNLNSASPVKTLDLLHKLGNAPFHSPYKPLFASINSCDACVIASFVT